MPALIDRRCRRKDWSKITSLDLYGKTLGIVGLGAVGRCVVRRARGFAMKILAHDIVWDAAWAAENGVERADLDRICREADCITLHTALTDATRNCINAARLASMKPTAILVNTARGGLVDEAALLDALRENRIYGAGLDVLPRNPRPTLHGTGWTILSWVRTARLHCRSNRRHGAYGGG